jgi:predicted nucleic acid-binding protein
MQPPSCTIDTSCIIALDHLDLLPKLSFLFSRILLPKAVRNELFRDTATKDRVQSLFNTYGFVKRCNDYDKGAVDILLIERVQEGMEDRGEAEAVVQATEVGAMVIVDDQWGRALAAQYNLDHHGTIWVIEQLHHLGLLSSSDVRISFEKLQKRKIWQPRGTVNALLVRIGEEPL